MAGAERGLEVVERHGEGAFGGRLVAPRLLDSSQLGVGEADEVGPGARLDEGFGQLQRMPRGRPASATAGCARCR
jgi:hypothetical protein